MIQTADQRLKERVRQWREAADTLQSVRDEDTRRANTAKALRFFQGSVLAALASHPPRPWSGLVEQQRCFGKLRRA